MRSISKRFVTTLLFILLFAAPSTWAETLTIPSITCHAGDTISVPVTIDSTPNLAGIKIVMTYDPKLLTYVDTSKTEYSSCLLHIVNDKSPGLLIIVMAGAQGIRGENFPIFILKFNTLRHIKKEMTTRIQITDAQLMSDQLKDRDYSVAENTIRIIPGNAEDLPRMDGAHLLKEVSPKTDPPITTNNKTKNQNRQADHE